MEVGAARRGYVIKREPVAGLLEPYDLEPEFRVLHALSDDPLPSPPTPWFERDRAVLDRPFYVMERLPGDVPIPEPPPPEPITPPALYEPEPELDDLHQVGVEHAALRHQPVRLQHDAV